MFRSNGIEIEDTYAEIFQMWVGRVLITAENKNWALLAAQVATGYASSIIGSPAEAGIEGIVERKETPDSRTGTLIQIYHHTRSNLKKQMINRIGQCVMTCPTTSAFDALPKTSRKLKVGRSLRLFGDGYQKKDELAGRKVWRIPVMEGEFIIENTFGTMKAVAGGNFLILAKELKSGLKAAEEAVKAINQKVKYVILPFPGGICRAGSKIGSVKYKLPASTNHPFCPKLKELISDTNLTKDVNSVYEIVINGLDINYVKMAMREGIKAAIKIPGVTKITAGNYGGKFGSMKIYLNEILE
jgi:formylmethanofuran--tetrahydromethanopterin N-formyltransferase